MEYQKIGFSPKLLLTQQTFDTAIFQFLSWLSTEYSFDKWHYQHIDIWWCTNTIGRTVYL